MKPDDAERIKNELHARIDPFIEDVARELARRLSDDAIYMTVAEYAEHAKVGEKTIRKWLKAGLPARRRGSIIRIPIAEADAWSMEGADRRSAELAAHGAKS